MKHFLILIICIVTNALPLFAQDGFFVIPVKKGDGHSLDAADGSPKDAV